MASGRQPRLNTLHTNLLLRGVVNRLSPTNRKSLGGTSRSMRQTVLGITCGASRWTPESFVVDIVMPPSGGGQLNGKGRLSMSVRRYGNRTIVGWYGSVLLRQGQALRGTVYISLTVRNGLKFQVFQSDLERLSEGAIKAVVTCVMRAIRQHATEMVSVGRRVERSFADTAEQLGALVDGARLEMGGQVYAL